jgi:hypothetical protein
MPNNAAAGVTAREIDNTTPTVQGPIGIPPGVISTTQKGPAFVPTIVGNPNDYKTIFGSANDKIKEGPLSAEEWLTYQKSFLQLRVLGAGDGKARNADGSVTNAGFVVGSEQPQAILSGAIAPNSYANTNGIPGRTFVLGCAMSQSNGSAYFTDAGLNGTSVMVRGMLFAPSGVLPTLSSSRAPSNDLTNATVGTPASAKGFCTGSVSLTNSQFTMLLNGHKGSTQFPRVVTASFDMTSQLYFPNIFNTDPLKTEQAGHCLYSWFDIHSSQAVVTGSGIVLPTLGAGALGTGLEDIAFLVSSSATLPNANQTNIPNFEGFEDRFSAGNSPWVISQNFGGTVQNLFKIWNKSDGKGVNYKISIENITPSTTDAYLYGTFDLLVRRFDDWDSNKVVLEQFRGLSLDPKSTKFIGKVIGDEYTYFNFDAPDGKQKLESVEDTYESNSNFIRVEIAENVKSGEMDPTALPMGFRGNQHLVTSGSAVFGSLTDSAYLSINSPFRTMVQPPVPMRLNLNKGASPVADRNLYWGVQFEQVTSATQPNQNIRSNNSLKNFAKYYPNYNIGNIKVAVKDNPGVADTTTNGILDADKFNNNLFSLEKIEVKYNSVSLVADVGNLTSWSYVRQGNIAPNTGALTRALKVSDLKDPSVKSVAKFSFFTEGGFDGTRIFDEDCTYLTNKAVSEEILNPNRGLTEGPTTKSYLKAIELLKDTSSVDVQFLLMPGIRVPYLTDTLLNGVEERFDALGIIDIEERDGNNLRVVDKDNQIVNVKNTVQDFLNRGLNTSFGAAYFPDVMLRNDPTRSINRVAPSVAILGAFAKNDTLGHPWTAAAGFTRGALERVDNLTVVLSDQNMSDLYSVGINPLISYPNEGPIVWGQKTLLATESAFERINVRRLLISIRRSVKKVANRILFEQNREATLARFKQLVTPILKDVQDKNGLEGYRVDIDATTTTQADIENKTVRGKIWIKPTKTVEFMSLDFVLNNAGASV